MKDLLRSSDYLSNTNQTYFYGELFMANSFTDLSNNDLSDLVDELSDLAGEMITENDFEIEILCGQGDDGDVPTDDLACSIFDLPATISFN